MAFNGDERQISLEEVVSAAVTHELAILVERLARERAWSSIVVAFGYAAGPRAAATIEEVRAAAEALRVALARIPPPKRPGAAIVDEMRAVRISAGEALVARLSHPPLGDIERRALRTAAEILSEGGAHRRAASAYEELGDDARAADAYGAMGDLEQMEAALEREDARLRAARDALDELRSFESLMAAGERRAALSAAARIPGEMPAAASVRQRARDVEGRLVRERAVTLRAAVAGGAPAAAIRFAAVPATLGRELLVEVPVRDPGVSRRHAVIVARDGELVLEDAGSRTGVRLAGAVLGAGLPLRGEGELGLGRDCRIHFLATAGPRVILRGVSGLDRQLVAVVGVDPFPLDELYPGAEGTWLELGAGAPRLGRTTAASVRVSGHYVGATCDLLHGDVIEIRPAAAPGGDAAPALRLEVDSVARFEADLVLEADRAEQAGDLAGATAALRRHLGATPSDAAARLRYARLLVTCGERQAARHELEALNRPGAVADGIAAEANRLLAELDESEGALARAALRWERVLADDIDDPQARVHLRRLRADEMQAPAEGASATLVSPEGVETLRYRLLRELGRGTTSAVYLARDQVLDIPIALKVLHPQLAGPARSEARRRFFAEARLAAALRHPGVIAIYDLDERARTLSMEYVPGGTLRARLRQAGATGGDGGTLDADELIASACSLFEALAYVHDRGVAHGDLKPSNLLLRRPGWLVLADFGIAQLAGGGGGGGNARAGEAPAGTPLYLAPEQFAGAPASPATDLYAAGAILWEMAMGRPLRDQGALVAGNLRDAPALGDAVVARLGAGGPALAEVIAGLTLRLASERAQRISSASDALARVSSLRGASPSSRS